LPATLKFVKAEGDGWDCVADEQLVTCDAAEVLSAGATAAFVIETTVTADPGSIITNEAIVSTATAERTEDNNTDTAEIATADDSAQSLGQAPRSPVAFTGANSIKIAGVAFLLMLAGAALIAVRRRSTGGSQR